jgi:hypothetical protein
VAQLLAEAGAPVVRPANTLPPGPHYVKWCGSNFSGLLRTQSRCRDFASDAGKSLRVVHDSLNAIRPKLPALPVFTLQIDEAAALLRIPDNVPLLPEEDRLFLHRLYKTVRSDIGAVSLNYQPLHGECHLGQAIFSSSGVRWLDSRRRAWGRRNGTSQPWTSRV